VLLSRYGMFYATWILYSYLRGEADVVVGGEEK
jgi:hypothetical protein